MESRYIDMRTRLCCTETLVTDQEGQCLLSTGSSSEIQGGIFLKLHSGTASNSPELDLRPKYREPPDEDAARVGDSICGELGG